ncbi:cyclin-T1-3-like [Wolffia australiana]
MSGNQACLNFDDASQLDQHRLKWYFSKDELEARSPSRKDGISVKKEHNLRLHYCTFLQELGMKLGLPQVAIATGIMFCHRFYLYQSLARSDWQTIAIVCIFLASKVEETPCVLSKLIPASYEMIQKKDPAAMTKVQSKEFFEKQKELIINGERLVLATLGFDLEILHPYKPLVAAIKKLGLVQSDLVKVAWNFVNDWLKTTLCLQYKPQYIAAGSLYLAAKVTKVKLPSEKGLVWWHEFDISPQQFEGVVRQMMFLFGFKGKSLLPSTASSNKENMETESEDQCSPESCVLSRPGSSGSTSHEHSVTVEDENSNIFIKSVATKESPGCGLDQESGPRIPITRNEKASMEEGCGVGSARTADAMITGIDKEKIKAALRKRKEEREAAKVVVSGGSGEEAWIEEELESGIEVVKTSMCKKPSL